MIILFQWGCQSSFSKILFPPIGRPCSFWLGGRVVGAGCCQWCCLILLGLMAVCLSVILLPSHVTPPTASGMPPEYEGSRRAIVRPSRLQVPGGKGTGNHSLLSFPLALISLRFLLLITVLQRPYWWAFPMLWVLWEHLLENRCFFVLLFFIYCPGSILL